MKAPEITCLVPSEDDYVQANQQYLQLPLPLSRVVAEQQRHLPFTYGNYFRGVAEVISKEGFRLLTEAVSKNSGKEVSPTDIEEIRIFAEKHGSDYHPARIMVQVGREWVSFVMNVAVTERGKTRLANEFGVLRHLTSKHKFFLLPRVYYQGEALVWADETGGRQTRLCMFLADWFQGYHEFHLSVDNRGGAQKLVLWKGNEDRSCLSDIQAEKIYAQIARIMTLYYDLETFEQIFPWHHAAGDFVVKVADGSVVVKLITARQYTSMIDPASEVSAYDALLLFLLNLSLRARLDRLDGVGALAWAGDACVYATMRGFLEGLKAKEQYDTKNVGVVDGFFKYAMGLTKEDLSDMGHALVGASDPAAPDMPLIMGHLETHVATFHGALQGLKFSDFPSECGAR